MKSLPKTTKEKNISFHFSCEMISSIELNIQFSSPPSFIVCLPSPYFLHQASLIWPLKWGHQIVLRNHAISEATISKYLTNQVSNYVDLVSVMSTHRRSYPTSHTSSQPDMSVFFLGQPLYVVKVIVRWDGKKETRKNYYDFSFDSIQ